MRFKTKFLKSDFKKRNKFKQKGTAILTQTCLFKNKILPLSIREHSAIKDIKQTQIRNRCIITGRQRGILSNFGVSRLVFRKEADKGNIPGLTSHE